jgi:hypothetical protein
MWILLILSMNGHGSVMSVVPNLSRVQCELLSAAVTKMANKQSGFFDPIDIKTECIELPK